MTDTGKHDTVLVYEGVESKDHRLIMPGALTWDELPLPVFRQLDNYYGTMLRVGAIVALRREGNTVWATLDIEMPEDHCLCLDGVNAVVDFEGTDINPRWVFRSMKVAAATIFPEASWAWHSE